MKITPAAIRSQSFETAFRGFEKKDVSAFLDEVSQVVEALNQENLDLKSKLQQVESEAKRLKDVEDSLFRTLKTAEDTGASIIEEANEAADQIISEANHTAEHATAHANQLLQESKQKAESQAAVIIGAAEAKAKETIVELRGSMQGLVRSYEGLVEQREALVKSLRRISQDSLNQIDLSDAHFSRIDAKAHQRAIEELSRSQKFTFANLEALTEVVTAHVEAESEFIPENQSEGSMDQMEVIEEQLELEAHASTPALEPEPESIQNEEPEVSEDELESAQDEITTLEKKQEIEAEKKIEQIVSQETPRLKDEEDPKKQSGSFFDQFD